MEIDKLEIISNSPQQTRDIGGVLGRNAAPGHVYLLIGDLGAGKTCITQGILRGLGSEEWARSPTFVLIMQYTARLPLYHIDLYRVNDARQAEDLGLDEYLFGRGVTVIEWADRAMEAMPPEHLVIQIGHLSGESRYLTFVARGAPYAPLIAALRAYREKTTDG